MDATERELRTDDALRDDALRAATLLDEALLDEALRDEALRDEVLRDEAVLDDVLLDEALFDDVLLDEAFTDGSVAPADPWGARANQATLTSAATTARVRVVIAAPSLKPVATPLHSVWPVAAV